VFHVIGIRQKGGGSQAENRGFTTQAIQRSADKCRIGH
jgi:hypothetical protein